MKDDMTEIWKEIPGTDGWFFASTEGRIKRKAGVMPGGRYFVQEKILALTPTGDGHLQVRVSGKLQTVHSLILLTFVGPRPEGMQIRHFDDNPANNRVGNSCYGTARENALDVSRLGNRGKPSAERAASILSELAGRSAWTYAEMGELAKRFGVCAATVRRIWKGQSWAV